ncbi:MAG: glycerol-3-phosphate 1-O-acyltransferase PlsY [Mobilitalea sp.]
MIAKIILCLLFGYVFGCFSTGYFMGKLNKVDIRQYGSGNVGTTNALRTLGAKAGAITLLGDSLKAIIPMVLVRFLFLKDYDYNLLLTLYTGFGVVLGHNYPVWLKFKGGKGIAATGGVMVAFDPLIVPFALPIFIAIVALTRYVSLGSLFVAVFLPVWIFIRYPGDLHMLILSLAFMVVAFIKHTANIKRLLNGTENKIGQKAKLVSNEKE